MVCHFGPNLDNISAGGTLSGPSNMNSVECFGAMDCTSGFMPSAGPSFPQTGNDLYCQATEHESKVASDNCANRTNSVNANKKYPCRDRGCKEGFNRICDRMRHEQTHFFTGEAKHFECPELGCNRKGEWGFMRRDKIVDHMRQKHKRSVRRDEFPTQYRRICDERNKWAAANGVKWWD